jgi:hypothetical protein
MLKSNPTYKFIFLFFFLTLMPSAVQSIENKPKPLDKLILELDQSLFDAFNACDLETWKKYLAEDIEFYQDNDDVTTTRKALEPSFIDRCRKSNKEPIYRKLVKESVQVHPIQGFGAVQFGSHQFWIVKDGKPHLLASTPKFVHLWHNNNGTWQITRVISYGH